MKKDDKRQRFPVPAGIILGLGLGGFFDGIVFHQLLQWHHMVTSAGYPADNLKNLEVNILWDGLFHTATYILVVAGLALLWRASRGAHLWWSTKLVFGTILIGFGLFNLVEGIVNHHLLGIHHVNEQVPKAQWLYWDIGFLISGLFLILIGLALYRSGKSKSLDYSAD